MNTPNLYIDFDQRDQWRSWLEKHNSTESEVWLVFYKKNAKDDGLSLEEAIQEALCFGWIDGKLQRLDENRYVLRYSPRTGKSIWSLSNINRVEKLIGEGKMTEAGLSKVAEAKENGEWQAAIQREKVDSIPKDLEQALARKKGALAAYRSLTDSRKKGFAYWLQSAKRKATREKRINVIVDEVLRK